MTDRFLTDATIQKYVEKYGKEYYITDIHQKLEKQKKEYERGRKHLLHVLQRIESDFK